MKKALIFGVSGQAGSYLVDFLLQKDYIVYGTYNSKNPYIPKGHLEGRYYTMRCDVTRPVEISNAIRSSNPDEIYNMASLMFTPASWKTPSSYVMVNAVAVSDMLNSYSILNPNGKFFQAGSADVFDREYPQSELTKLHPRNPYGVSKLAAQELVRVYREEKQFYACTGIFFNMESPRRDKFFFTRKVIIGVKALLENKIDKLVLGNLQAKRDWGLTEEYVEAAWLMLQHKPNDYVIGTGECHSCLEFVDEACRVAKVNMAKVVFEVPVLIDEDKSLSDPSKIKDELGWSAKSKFKEIVRSLVEAELNKTV